MPQPSPIHKLSGRTPVPPARATVSPVGRFRSGRMVDSLPEALSTWRVTSSHLEIVTTLAQLLGGEVGEWEAVTDDRFEVLTDTPALRILLDGPEAISMRMTQWWCGELVHHCDGAVLVSPTAKAGEACGCPATLAERRSKARLGLAPLPSTELRFRLADHPHLGEFVFESASWEFAEHAARLRTELAETPTCVAISLSLEAHSFTSLTGLRVSCRRPTMTLISEHPLLLLTPVPMKSG